MICANRLAIVVVVLHPNFRELGWIPGEIGRPPGLISPQLRHERGLVAAREFATESRDDSWFNTPQNLSVCAVIRQDLARQDNGWIGFGNPLRSIIVAP